MTLVDLTETPWKADAADDCEREKRVGGSARVARRNARGETPRRVIGDAPVARTRTAEARKIATDGLWHVALSTDKPRTTEAPEPARTCLDTTPPLAETTGTATRLAQKAAIVSTPHGSVVRLAWIGMSRERMPRGTRSMTSLAFYYT